MAGTNSSSTLVNEHDFNRRFFRHLAGTTRYAALAVAGAVSSLGVFVVIALPWGK